MKVIAIGRNYTEHIKELNNEKPDEPVIFTKPDTAILRHNEAFYYPSFSNEVHYEVELVLKISKNGKYIEEKFANRYFDAIGIGIDFTARDLQSKAKAKSLPWAISKGFDGAAPISEFLSVTEFSDLKNINFSLKINNELRQDGNTSLMLYDFAQMIAYVSKFITLKKGDLIFTGTPKGVGEVKVGDRLQAYIEDKEMMDFEVK